MHEASLAETLLRQVTAVRDERGLKWIHTVTIQLGTFSGVEPMLLKSAFEERSARWLGRVAELRIESVELQAECDACGRRFKVIDFRFQCPTCPNAPVRIVQGENLMLLSLSAEADT